MGQLAGDLLSVALVIPEVRVGGLVFEFLDPRPQGIDVEHPLHRRQGGVERGDLGLPIDVHGSQVTGAAAALITIPGCALLRRRRRRGSLRLLRGGLAAALRRRVGGRRRLRRPIDMLEMLPTLGFGALRVAPDHPRSSRSAARSRRPGPIPGSGSSAMSLWAGTSRPTTSPGATTPSSMRWAPSPTAHSAFRARGCRAASPRWTSSAGTTPIRTSPIWRRTSPAAGRWSSATAMSRSAWPASW